MNKVSISNLESAVKSAGLQLRDCGLGHYQVIGGTRLVNFYDTTKGSKVYVEGERKGRPVSSVAQVIEATGAKQKPKSIDAEHEVSRLKEENELRTAIKTLLERIAKAERYKAGAWSKVIDYARKYAMVKSFGHFINEDGHREMIPKQDVAMYEKQFVDSMCREAVIALSEDSMPRE